MPPSCRGASSRPWGRSSSRTGSPPSPRSRSSTGVGREGDPEGRVIDVLSLSMGYYHETAYDSLFDPTLFGVLSDLASRGTLVVCSAGNDATARPCFPAAFAPWREDEDGNDGSVVHPPAGQLPILSVGALNPNLVTDALFSNAGEWVRSFFEGAAVMSTVPGFQGGLSRSPALWPSAVFARTSTRTTSAAGSASGAVRRSPPR